MIEIEYNKYQDDRLSILLPKQLKQKNPTRFFRGNLERGKSQSRMVFGIDIDLVSITVETFKEEVRRINIDNRPSGDWVERYGPCKIGQDGHELLTSFIQQDTRFLFHCWDLMFKINKTYVIINFMGGGSLEEFESIARTIVKSLKIL